MRLDGRWITGNDRSIGADGFLDPPEIRKEVSPEQFRFGRSKAGADRLFDECQGFRRSVQLPQRHRKIMRRGQ